MEQISLRNLVNTQLYSLTEKAWQDAKVVTQFKEAINKLDLRQHQRLPVGSLQAGRGDAQLEGLVYEDLYGVILSLYRASCLKSQGIGLQGAMIS